MFKFKFQFGGVGIVTPVAISIIKWVDANSELWVDEHGATWIIK